jgi:hypothetical protein
MKKLVLLLMLLGSVTLISSNGKQKVNKPDLVNSLDSLKQSVIELNSILNYAK